MGASSSRPCAGDRRGAPEAVSAEAIAAYHRLLEADPRAAVEQSAWLADAFRRSGITFAGAPMQSFLRPHFLARAQWDGLRADGRWLLELAVRVARDAFAGDAGRLCAWLGIPSAQAAWITLDPGPPDVVLSRLDAFLTPQGPRFIEVNSDAPAGFGYGDRMAEVFAQLPVFQTFAREWNARYEPSAPALVAAVQEARPGATGVVAIVDWEDVKTRPDQEILAEVFRAAGVPCVLADPREVELRRGHLWARRRRVDVVYRRALLAELAQRAGETRALLDAYRGQNAVFVNSFRCHLSEDKAFLALLTDEAFAGLLTAAEHERVRALVPWTRKLEDRRTRWRAEEVDLLAFAREQQQGLVLKPAHGYGGQSVLVGADTPAAAWDAALRRGTGEAWVLQERVPIPVEEFPVVAGGALGFEPLHVNVNPFYVAGRAPGAVSRASRGAVINVSAGGGSVPVFVLES
jgi:uncharacterized circularly permuted ATP-grasp superfamily protein